tara:strand:+ start:225 stop:431 length:207 start_codon:yes stop_codon:yes gene_type:complete
MAITYSEDGKKKVRKGNKKPVNIAGNISGMPDHVYESIKRQYSGKDYTIEDKKNVINYYKKKNKKGKV